MTKHVIYVDVTQLVHFEGPVTGIPRVMHELAVRFHDDTTNTIFVSWVKEVGAYCLVEYDASILHRGNGIKYVTETATANAHTKNSVNEPTTPSRNRSRPLLSYAKRAIKYVIRQADRIRPGVSEKLFARISEEKAKSYKKVDFKRGDTVFIGWGEWWDKHFLAMLEKSHQDGVHITTIIHDIGPMITPHLSGHSQESLAEYCRRIVPLCSVVFVNSNYTGKELKMWLAQNDLHVPKISTFTIGDNFSTLTPKRPTNELFTKSGLEGDDYIMAVGTVELKKNHMLLYYVYYLAAQRGIDLPKLVIVGRKGWHTESVVEMMERDPALNDKFLFMSGIGDDELAWLYKNSLFTVFPSFYEGWGIPIAESLYYGTPVASANVTSMLEIGDGIVERFSPASTDECLAVMQKLLDPDYRKSVQKKVAAYTPKNWDDTFIQIKTALEKEKLL